MRIVERPLLGLAVAVAILPPLPRSSLERCPVAYCPAVGVAKAIALASQAERSVWIASFR